MVESTGASLLAQYADRIGLDKPFYRDPGIMRAHFGQGDGRLIKAGDREFNGWTAMLNTALAVGSDALCFLAVMHARCELHAWVAGEHRLWLADIIEQGVRDGLCRKSHLNMAGDASFSSGWPELIAALRRTAENPVVMSYSVCDQFPNLRLWSRSADTIEHHNAFYAATTEERWARCMPAIADIQITPENLRARFGDGASAFDVLALI